MGVDEAPCIDAPQVHVAFTLAERPLNAIHAPAFSPTSFSPVTFVRVRASEAALLSEFAIELFDTTYGPLCRASDVDAYMTQSLSPSAWLRDLTDSKSWVFAAVANEQWIGYAHVRLAALPDGIASTHVAAVGTTPLEIARFYVSRKWHGKGVATEMLSTVLSHAATQGSASLWLSVWQENARAIAFYQKSKFETIGTGKFLMGEDLQSDFIMERAVAKPPAPDAA